MKKSTYMVIGEFLAGMVMVIILCLLAFVKM